MKLERELSTSERDALQASISEKLAEILGVACDPVLAEYTIVLVSNGKTMEELREAMNEMIGPDMSASLAAWLGEELKPLEVRVDPSDLGRVIGRQGRTATALRTVLEGLAGHPVRVDVVDTDRRR